MTDIRRQSTDGRVATPKIGSQGMTDLDATLTKVVGARYVHYGLNASILLGEPSDDPSWIYSPG